MTRIVVLPNENLCPDGAVVEAEPGESICRALLRNDIEIEPVRKVAKATMMRGKAHTLEFRDSLVPNSLRFIPAMLEILKA